LNQLDKWPVKIARSVWKAAQAQPTMALQKYKEWNGWRDGTIYTITPDRKEVCAACGEVIPGGTPCLLAVDLTEASMPLRRHVHLEPCI
jgi:hypothetical protein